MPRRADKHCSSQTWGAKSVNSILSAFLALFKAGRDKEAPKYEASAPTSGSADLCFITLLELKKAMRHVVSFGVVIVQGPVRRTGARAMLDSFYFRDPSGNLIEVANEVGAT